MKFKKAIPEAIAIHPTINGGFIVTVGCVKLAYSGLKDLRKDMDEYLADPEKVMDEYEKARPHGQATEMPDPHGLADQIPTSVLREGLRGSGAAEAQRRY